MASADHKASFARRFLIYQKERYPFLLNGIVIPIFTFSAVSYSRLCRRADGFIAVSDFITGIFATITLFFLVRIFDEFKDRDDDARYRPYLPVPRGLISLKELRITGWIVGILQVVVIAALQPEMLPLYVLVLGYLSLMGVEFFAPQWLRKRQIAYITSHMFIIPLVDIYASGLDWRVDGASPHWGLAWFFAVSYMNGLALEFGRKIRTPETEEEKVVSYTGLYGLKGGTLGWIGLMFVTFLLAVGASAYAGFGIYIYLIMAVGFAICSLPGWLFLYRPTVKRSRQIEMASAGWTAIMYLSLGGIPMIKLMLS